jgi:hypothetical protein
VLDWRRVANYFTQSLFRAVELALAVGLLLTAGFGAWLVWTTTGRASGPEAGGVFVGLLLLAALLSVLLSLVVIVHAVVDLVRLGAGRTGKAEGEDR